MTITLNGTTGIQNVLGSAAAPAESNTTNSNTGVYFPTSTTLGFSTAGTNAVYIDANQNVNVGTTTSVSTAKLNVTNGTQQFQFGNGVGPSSAFVSYLNLGGVNGFASQTSSTGSIAHYQFYNPNGAVGSIVTNGSTTTYNPSSDARLKENIAPITNGIERVSKLKPVDYNWKSDGRLDNGFIAQDLLAEQEFAIRVSPVGKTEDGSDMYGVDYMKFVAVLTAAIQEQQALITQLTDRIAALEAK
jgi:hypothetical protein